MTPELKDPLTLVELRTSFLVTGAGVGSAAWDTAWRSMLVDNLEILIGHLRQVGVERIFVDGSFVEAKINPATSTRTLNAPVTSFLRRSSRI